ncbi:peptidoglycan DD-metalloendopeptidase family protein [Bdellovibrio sp. HCB337]|uniref:M23 family metallopeptidase n=1 Tax=Bdellovibrio sp. HCB337 TaxID=3394358 RepID=UPI0039A713A3
MTKWNVSLTAWLLASLIPVSASAAAPTPNVYIWNNTRGFVDASTCTSKPAQHAPLYIAQKPNSDLNASSKFKGQGFFKGLFSGVLVDRTLIAMRGIPSTDPSILVRVLSVPHNAHQGALTNIANPKDEGTVEKDVLQDIGNFVIEVADTPALLKTTKSPFEVKKTYWQAAMDKDHYTLINCAEGTLMMEYVVFDVYNTTNINPVAQVGLRYDQTDILNSINVYTPDEANQAVAPGDTIDPDAPPANGGNGGSIPVKPPVNDGGNSDTTPPNNGGDTGTPQVPVTDGKLEYVICTDEPDVDVMDPELAKVLFQADQFEAIVPIQSWNEKQKSEHIEVQFPERGDSQKSGWIPRSVVQLKADCKEMNNDSDSDSGSGSGDSDNYIDMRDVVLNTKDCCKFPTIKRASQSYAVGTPRFRAQRARGRRLHAGCDLYRKRGETAVAVASGVVIRGLYYFYQGVFAIEIRHPKFVARYGEILGSPTPGVAKGKIVKAGQEIGRIGKVSSGCCLPMLHFELYKGTTAGSLTRYRRPPYDRRSDLMDPTPLLRQWEKAQFGSSY